MNVAHANGLCDRLDAIDGIELDGRRAEIGIDGVDRKPELDGYFFADAAITGQLQAGDFALA